MLYVYFSVCYLYNLISTDIVIKDTKQFTVVGARTELSKIRKAKKALPIDFVISIVMSINHIPVHAYYRLDLR